ncbi:aspartate aminotransferase [Dactylonectria macrodidyma]|uniref:aspartate transaminase n=1 Tax=Dactylonectria macrodidyma TaxID=307937 RepID=A0A9P9F9H8_9HYPO|nr:aspartate aminotransferase [Dactylonectria macrodidyma]
MALNEDNTSQSSRFSKLRPAQPGGPFALEADFRADTDPRKVNLIIGAYRDDSAQPWQLTSVTQAKKQLNVESCFHEYLPLRGSSKFLEGARLVLFGPERLQKDGQSIASIQTVSGTGANSLIAMFLHRHLHRANVWLPDPTWVNHVDIWKINAPGVGLRWYPYYDEANRCFDFDAMLQTLYCHAQEHDVILLHACAHNPTGMDPTKEQWRGLARLCEEKKLFVVFDSAYQGFASGDLDHDAWAVRHFSSYPTIELAVCQSFSKNLGLYGERTGALHVLVSRAASHPIPLAPIVQDNLVDLHRASVSMAPLFGSLVATRVLGSSDLRSMWKGDLLVMSGRIKAMRTALYEELVRLQTPGSWKHIVEQTGMFSYTGLTKDQVSLLQSEHHVYMLPSGRASICGLTNANVLHTAQAIHDVVVRLPA